MNQKTLFDDQPSAAEMQPVFQCKCGQVSAVCWWHPDEPPMFTLEDDDDTVWCRGCHRVCERVAVTVFLGQPE